MSSLATARRDARRDLRAAAPPRISLQRVVLWCTVLVFISGVALGLAVAVGAVAFDNHLSERIHEWFTEATWTRQLSVVAGALAAVVILSALALRPTRRDATQRRSRHVLAADNLGLVLVSSQGLSSLARAAALREQGVLDADVSVHGGGATPVRIVVRAGVLPGTPLKETGMSVRDSARDAVERLGGIDVSHVVAELVVTSPERLERILE